MFFSEADIGWKCGLLFSFLVNKLVLISIQPNQQYIKLLKLKSINNNSFPLQTCHCWLAFLLALTLSFLLHCLSCPQLALKQPYLSLLLAFLFLQLSSEFLFSEVSIYGRLWFKINFPSRAQCKYR